MTCIVYKNGVLAADKSMIRFAVTAPVTKIRKVLHGTTQHLCGYSGKISEAERFFDWVAAGSDVDDWPFKSQAGEPDNDTGLGMVVVKNPATGNITIYQYDNGPYAITIERQIHAIGSDHVAALSCIWLGHNPVDAINAISNFSILTGSGVDQIFFD